MTALIPLQSLTCQIPLLSVVVTHVLWLHLTRRPIPVPMLNTIKQGKHVIFIYLEIYSVIYMLFHQRLICLFIPHLFFFSVSFLFCWHIQFFAHLYACQPVCHFSIHSFFDSLDNLFKYFLLVCTVSKIKKERKKRCRWNGTSKDLKHKYGLQKQQ